MTGRPGLGIFLGLFGLMGSWGLGFIACGPNLERLDGTLAVVIQDIPDSTDNIQVEVRSEASSTVFTAAPLVIDRRSGVTIESIPTGTVAISVGTYSGQLLVTSAEASVYVPADQFISVELSLAEPDPEPIPDPVEPTPDPLVTSFMVFADDGIRNEASPRIMEQMIGDGFMAAFEKAEEELMAEPQVIGIKGFSICVDETSHPSVRNLGDLWSGVLIASIRFGEELFPVAALVVDKQKSARPTLLPNKSINKFLNRRALETAEIELSGERAPRDFDSSGFAVIEITVAFEFELDED